MSLQIIKKETPLDLGPLVTTIVGLPGLGKTTLALTAKNPLLIDCSGSKSWKRAMWRAENMVECTGWDQIVGITKEDLEPFDTVVVDTVGELVNLIIQVVIKEAKVNSVGGLGKEISLKGWGPVKNKITQWIQDVRSFGKDIVFVCHAVEQQGKNESQNQYRIDIAGSTRNYLYAVSDLMGLLIMTNNQRQFVVKATDESFGKSPPGIDNLVLPNYETSSERDTLAKMVEKTKMIFEQKNQEGTRLNDSLKELKDELENLGVETDEDRETTAKTLTELASKGSSEDWTDQHKQVLWVWANEQGFGYDATKKAFLVAPVEPPPAKQAKAPANAKGK